MPCWRLLLRKPLPLPKAPGVEGPLPRPPQAPPLPRTGGRPGTLLPRPDVVPVLRPPGVPLPLCCCDPGWLTMIAPGNTVETLNLSAQSKAVGSAVHYVFSAVAELLSQDPFGESGRDQP